jgi:hypothetical protein
MENRPVIPWDYDNKTVNPIQLPLQLKKKLIEDVNDLMKEASPLDFRRAPLTNQMLDPSRVEKIRLCFYETIAHLFRHYDKCLIPNEDQNGTTLDFPRFIQMNAEYKSFYD